MHGGILTLTLSEHVTRSRLMDSSAEPQQNPVWLLNVGAVRLTGAVSRISEGSGSSQKLDEVRLPALRGRWAQLVGGGVSRRAGECRLQPWGCLGLGRGPLPVFFCSLTDRTCSSVSDVVVGRLSVTLAVVSDL